MDLQQNKTVVRHLFEVINNGELDQLRDVVDANVVDHNAVIFMQPEGPGAVEGDQVVARLTMSGTNTGEYRGLPAPTQQHFRSEAIAILRIADAKVTEIRGTTDRLGMLTQLGILPDIG
jgi:ketosteroid isomerase-like protein